MRSFYYRSGKNAFYALLLAGLALLAAKFWFDDGGWVVLAFATLVGAGAAKAAANALSSEPALRFDERCVAVRKAWGGLEEVPWGDVHDVAAKVLTMRYMGIIPVSRTAHITITCEGGVFGARRLRVSTTAMGLSVNATAELVAALKQAHVDAVGGAGVAMAGAGKRGWGVDMSQKAPAEAADAQFDADAALARYLASKEAAQSQPIPVAAAAYPGAIQRPSFGRRIS